MLIADASIEYGTSFFVATTPVGGAVVEAVSVIGGGGVEVDGENDDEDCSAATPGPSPAIHPVTGVVRHHRLSI